MTNTPRRKPASLAAAAADPTPGSAGFRAQLDRLRAEGGTYRSIASAAGLAPAPFTTSPPAAASPPPPPPRPCSASTATPCPERASTPEEPGCGCAPCT
jgi:hypothetical protein